MPNSRSTNGTVFGRFRADRPHHLTPLSRSPQPLGGGRDCSARSDHRGARRGNCRAAADQARDSRSRYTARHPPARYRAGGVVGTRFPRVRQHRVTQRRIATCTSSGTISLPDGITERISASRAVYAAVSSRYPRAWSRWLRGNAQRSPPPKLRRGNCLERITRTVSNP
jgi:hypothetical protein